MVRHPRVIAASLMIILAACDGTAGGSADPGALESGEAIVAATASPAPTDSATAQPTSEPALPAPPKPTGVAFDVHNEAIEGAPSDLDGIGDFILTVTWERPRTKDTVIRVYGVTKCFEPPADAIDTSCLRKHTPLPSRVRVLVAKASAPKGTVTFRLPLGGDGGYASIDGRPIYSLVIRAYNESGHSIFEIVDPGIACGRVAAAESRASCDMYWY